MSDDPAIPGRWFAVLVAASAVATALLLAIAHERVVLGRSTAAAVIGGAALLGYLRFGLRDGAGRWRRVCADAAEQVGIFSAICLLGAVASYPEAADSSGFADPALARIDAALGFDWCRWYALVAAHPVLQWLGVGAYQSIFLSPALLLGHYALAGERDTARRFLLAFWLAAVLSLALFPHLPAVGPLAYLWRGAIPYMPTSALYQAELIPALRSHAMTVVNVGALRGLVCAPSFHTASAILYAGFAWRVPALRWPLLGLNAAMLLATPVEGTHYLADMLLGAGVAAAAMMATELATARVAWPEVRRRAARPAPAARGSGSR